MKSQPLLAVIEQQVLRITLHRPDAMNALNPSLLRGLAAALDQAQAQGDVRAVVITGAGRAFCAGADLKFVQGDQAAATGRFLDELGVLLNRIEAFPVPVIAAVNGLALAGGLELVLCCDLVLAARSARFGDAHANYGLLPGGGGSVRLPRRIGATRAKYLMLTGELVTASAMETAGLVSRVVDDEVLPAEALALAGRIAARSPLALARMKRLVDDGLEQPAAVALRQELQVVALHRHSADMREGLLAFKEKREPRFGGR